VVRNKLVSVDSVHSPVSQVFIHHHRDVVAVYGRNGKRLVGTEVHHGARMASRRDHIGIGHPSQTFSYTTSDRFFFVDNHHLEAVSGGTTLESYLHSMIHTTYSLYALYSMSTLLRVQNIAVVTFENRNIVQTHCAFTYIPSSQAVRKIIVFQSVIPRE